MEPSTFSALEPFSAWNRRMVQRPSSRWRRCRGKGRGWFAGYYGERLATVPSPTMGWLAGCGSCLMAGSERGLITPALFQKPRPESVRSVTVLLPSPCSPTQGPAWERTNLLLALLLLQAAGLQVSLQAKDPAASLLQRCLRLPLRGLHLMNPLLLSSQLLTHSRKERKIVTKHPRAQGQGQGVSATVGKGGTQSAAGRLHVTVLRGREGGRERAPVLSVLKPWLCWPG